MTGRSRWSRGFHLIECPVGGHHPGVLRYGFLALSWVAAMGACLQPASPGDARRAPARGQPRQHSILVTHPTRAFIDSLANLRQRGELPDAHFVFLMHEAQEGRKAELREYLMERGISSFDFVLLRGLPAHLSFAALVARAEKPFPDSDKRRFHIGRNPYLPLEWKETFRALVDSTDGLFVPGGSNMPAAYYGAEQSVDGLGAPPVRFVYEYALLSFLMAGDRPYLARRPRYVVMGFCYGLQAINVAMGGTLWQSIPVEIYGQRTMEAVVKSGPANMHRNYYLGLYPSPAITYRGWFHPLVIVRESPWARPEKGVYILSNHEQAVRELGRDLRILATSEDGRVVEMLEHTRFPGVAAVQGHPERRFAWKHMGLFPSATARFHSRFFAQLRRTLAASRKDRVGRAPARAPNGEATSPPGP